MGYERYSRSDREGSHGRDDQDRGRQDEGRSYRSSQDRDQGPREYGQGGYADRDRQSDGHQGGQYGYPRDHGQQDRDAGYYQGGQNRDYGRADMYGQQERTREARWSGEGHGRDGDRDQGRSRQGYGARPQGYDHGDRGFLDRAGDEVRSWFGDDDANRRRDADARGDEQRYGNRDDQRGWNQQQRSGGQHDDYHSWRKQQIDALDRDYDEYRQENRSKFDTEFGSWRNQRQTQRASLAQVNEHMEVVGSDGQHVGTVDKVRGDRIILTKNDQDAGGRHHSIPSRWLQSIDDKVTISKTADDAKAHWRDEERNQAFFNEDGSHKDDGAAGGDRDKDGHVLNRSFSGTY